MRSQLLDWKKGAIIAALIVAAFAAWWAFYMPAEWGSDEIAEVTIAEGESLSQIAAALESAGAIRSNTAFVLYVKLLGRQSDLKAGTYVLTRSLNTHQVMSIIADGRSVSTDVVVLIPEGLNIWEIDERLAVAGLIKEGDLAKNYPHKEGHLFPDTYRFAPDASLKEIVDMMEKNFIAKTGVKSDIAIIVASMLEKEARAASDMALVSGIIQKRMDMGMLLQLDATVGYGWCLKRFSQTGKNCDVTQAPIANEIKIDGPYNTYKRTGLPQGPIANPGSNALKAAANPKASDYLYYLSTRDGSQIIYSKTYEEHLRNRSKYLGF